MFQKYCTIDHKNTPAIVCDRLSFSFDQKFILNNVTFSIPQGSFSAIIGENGVGKTTLLRLIMGLLEPNSGTVSVLGHNPTKQRTHIAYVPQKNNFNSGFPASVYEVVSAGVYPKLGFIKYLSKDDKVKVDEIIELVGLSEHSLARIGELSGGQQQRVFLARALLYDASLMIFDEPTANLDTASTHAFFELLSMLKERNGITMVMVTHDHLSISRHATHILELSRDYGAKELTPAGWKQDVTEYYKTIISANEDVEVK